MKKTLLVGLVGLIAVTGAVGCGNKEEKQQENNNALVDKIQDLQTDGDIKEFEGLMVLNENTIQSEMGLTKDDLDNFIAQVPYPTGDVDSKIYLVLKPAKGKEDRVKKLVGLYIDSIKTRLESKLPMTEENEEELSEEEKAQRDSVKKSIDMISNVMTEEYKGYLIYISSSDNDKVLSTIKKGL